MRSPQSDTGVNRQKGFTLVEILIALGLSGILFGVVVSLFSFQQASYTAQIQLMALQQNLRTALNIISRDIRMAGYGASADRDSYDNLLDWDPRNPGMDLFFPRLHGIDNLIGISGYKNGSDVLLIVKASKEQRALAITEFALPGDHSLFLNSVDLDADGDADFNTTGKRFGMLMKADFSRSELFKILSDRPTLQVANPFRARYQEGDLVARADIVIYRIDDRNASFDGAVLERKNSGNGNRFQVVAEGITDLQCRYVLTDGSQMDTFDGAEPVESVMVTVTGQTSAGKARLLRRSLTTLVTIRNT